MEILKGLLLNYPGQTFGLMTHANVSDRFTELFCQYPYTTETKYYDESVDISKLVDIDNNLIKISDSGAFQKNGKVHPYPELFQKYNALGVHYGIINDVLQDMDNTIKSAIKAINTYDDMKKECNFELMGVAQGKTPEEYCKCYGELESMGYKTIAVGGLLKRNGDSNYVMMNGEVRMKNIVTAIKEKYGPEKLFTLGIYHPNRHDLLESLDIWGADYKGWLFHYDEYYYTSKKLLEESGKYTESIENAYKHFMKCKSNHVAERSPENRKMFLNSKKLLDAELKKIDTSLQEFRYREVRKTLEEKIVLKMISKGIDESIFEKIMPGQEVY
ncbi:hypothetical protein [Methanococcus maripaludis]|uniref:hypothetical protein n=1 Tax=Methanococcus maripaludis TaxID=39152 RepID=UPI001B801D60|nr:hypothetical protein [Methanococcus maripaludis]